LKSPASRLLRRGDAARGRMRDRAGLESDVGACLQAMVMVMARPNADGLKIACKQAPTAWGRGTRADVRSRGLGVGVGACLQAMVRMVARPNADGLKIACKQAPTAWGYGLM